MDNADLESAPPSPGLAPDAPPEEANAPEVEAESGGIVGHLQSVAEPVASAVEPIVDAIGTVIGMAGTAISGRSAVERRLRRRNRQPLASLYEVYPEARQASPRELGLRFVPLEEIKGTAVAGAAQRGGDFLPLGPFRGENWEARWQRIRVANERLQPLPPVDLVKYAGSYWVLDGHNRVAAALYADGAGLDAMVTELIPLDGQTSERPTDLAGLLTEAGELRAAAAGHRPAFAIRYGDQHLTDQIETLDEPRRDEPGRDDSGAGEPGAGEPGAGEPGAGEPSAGRSVEPVEH